MSYAPVLCALSNVPICCLIEMPGAEPPLSPTAEDEPLSTDPANWPSPLTDRIRILVCTVSYFAFHPIFL